MMKKLLMLMLLTLIIGNIGAADTVSFQFIEHLLSLHGQPPGPRIVEDAVVFTASSSFRRVGIAFAHEGFRTVHQFQRLMVPNDDPGPWLRGRPPADLHIDSGILFYVFAIPEHFSGSLEYRLVIDGLWTRDPLNPNYRFDPLSGVVRSVLAIPPIARPDHPNRGPEGALTFTFHAPPGDIVTVAGSFNGWDPFMFRLPEISPGRFQLILPLPPGTYQYIFFHRGQRRLDPNNPRSVYNREGRAVSEATVQ